MIFCCIFERFSSLVKKFQSNSTSFIFRWKMFLLCSRATAQNQRLQFLNKLKLLLLATRIIFGVPATANRRCMRVYKWKVHWLLIHILNLTVDVFLISSMFNALCSHLTFSFVFYIKMSVIYIWWLICVALKVILWSPQLIQSGPGSYR